MILKSNKSDRRQWNAMRMVGRGTKRDAVAWTSTYATANGGERTRWCLSALASPFLQDLGGSIV